MKKYLLLGALFLLFAKPIIAQASHPEWSTYNTSNSGIADNVITDLAIDKSGIKWIGTRYGLCKFDDVSWTVYKTSNSGLPGNLIQGITLDKTGNIWVATNQGIARYNDSTTWTVYNMGNSSLPTNDVKGIIMDTSGIVWAATMNGIVNFNNGIWTVLPANHPDSIFSQANAITIDKRSNTVWVGTASGLVKILNGIQTFYHTSGIHNLDVDSNGIVWHNAPSNGLMRFNGTTWTNFNTGNSSLPDDNLTAIKVDLKNNIWIGTNNGLAVFDGMSNWINYNTGNSGLPDNRQLSIAFENCRNKPIKSWIGCTLGTNGGLGVLSEIYNPICMVTSDSVNANNIIIWEKQAGRAIDSFRIYRETNVSNVYEVAGSVSANQLSRFRDVTSNVNQQSYRYKIMSVSPCGQKTYSGIHKTMHVTINAGAGSWNLIWEAYEGLSYNTVNIWRGTSASTMSKIGSVPGTNLTYSDLSPPAGTLYYQLEIASSGCTPTHSTYSSVFSNKANTNMAGILNFQFDKLISIYPNPSSGLVNINVSGKDLEGRVRLFNPSGCLLYDQMKSFTGSKYETIDLSQLPQGVYFIQCDFKEGQITKKLVLIN